MTRRREAWAVLLGVVALSLSAALAQQASVGGFGLSWHTIDGGGGSVAGGTFELTGTMGQPDAGATMAGGDFVLAGGFLAIGAPDSTTCSPDISPPGGDGMVNINDLLEVIGAWGVCPAPCPPHCNADITDDCDVNINDLLAVIGGWGLCP